MGARSEMQSGIQMEQFEDWLPEAVAFLGLDPRGGYIGQKDLLGALKVISNKPDRRRKNIAVAAERT